MKIPVSDILEYSYINDYETENLQSENPALYLRRMWGYLHMGWAMIRRPRAFTELELIKPRFGYAEMISDGSCIWNTDLLYFDTVTVYETNTDGDTLHLFKTAYEPDAGIVTLQNAPDEDSLIAADAYADGWFEAPDDFAYETAFIHLCRIAAAAAFNERFSNSSLDRISKPSDRVFAFKSEANWLKENHAKAIGTRIWLDRECERVEQMLTLAGNVRV